jgi:pimeloyl-ACP methyl ester carboxylesterase
VAQLPLFGLTMLVPQRRALTPLADDGHPPVLFVHGLGGRGGNFFPMRLYFRSRGRRRTYALSFDERQGLDGWAHTLTAGIDEVMRNNGLAADAQVDLVAHSMGGLVARIALDDPAVAARVRTLVTIGTPHDGTHIARFGGTALALALRPDSPQLERLRGQLPWGHDRPRPRLISLWSPSDIMLIPTACARVEGAENREIPGYTHHSYLLSPAFFRMVMELLPPR